MQTTSIIYMFGVENNKADPQKTSDFKTSQ